MQKKCKSGCTDLDCGNVHIYKYCYNYQNTTCREKDCPFLHCTGVEQYRYEITGKATENLKREVGRTLQNVDICNDFKKNICHRVKCNFRHIKLDDMEPLQCPICREQIIIESFGAAICGHIFCYNCALKCISRNINEETIKVDCPMCRSENVYKKFI